MLVYDDMMEEAKRDNTNKTKRARSDSVGQTVLSYLHRRNYPSVTPTIVTVQDFILSSFIENEISRPNSILYSCFNNDPIIIDYTFSKFLTWLTELHKTKGKCEDLEVLVGPLFCHIYLEILRGGHMERAASFFKLHRCSVDISKCDSVVKELINAFSNDCEELLTLKDIFRSNKYVVYLSTESVNYLKRFLVEAGHLVLLQVFQSWFTIQEIEHLNQYEDDYDEDVEDLYENVEGISGMKLLYNGKKSLSEETSISEQEILDAIESIQNEPISIYSTNIADVKDEVTCGVLNRSVGVCAYSYNNNIILRSLKTLEALDNVNDCGEISLLGHSGRIYDINFINNYEYLISASQDKTIRLYDLQDYSLKNIYTGHEYPIYCLSVSTAGNYFVSGSYDHSARLWSVDYKECLRIFAGHTQEIVSMNVHPNSIYIATGSVDKTIRMWSIQDAKPLRLFLGAKGAIYSVAFSPKGKYLAGVGEDKRLRIWDLVSGKQLVELKVDSQPVIRVAFDAEETTIATGSVDGTLQIWDLNVLIRTGEDTNLIEPLLNIALTPKLLSLDYSFGIYSCLTAQHTASISMSV